MGLKQDEAGKAYKTLSTIVYDAKLDWLVSDVERQIALGKQVKKKIKVPDPEAPLHSHLSSKQKGESKPKTVKGKLMAFVISEDYSANERLELLVDAVEAVSPGLSMALLETMSFIESKLKNFSALEFSQDREGGEVLALPKDFQNRKEIIDKLAKSLRNLKEAIQ